MTDVTTIYVGKWVNYSTGTLTLTLSPKAAGFLASSLVIWLGLVATQSWSITKFCIHQCRARERPRNGFHHQQQAIVRNSPDAEGMIISITRSFWAWKSQFSYSYLMRTLMLLLIGVICFVSWTAAEEFVSLIWTTPSDEVLLRSPNCGYSVPTDTLNPQVQQDFRVMVSSFTVDDGGLSLFKLTSLPRF
jgi:hypothetical protein